jgi:hypothetical protein
MNLHTWFTKNSKELLKSLNLVQKKNSNVWPLVSEDNRSAVQWKSEVRDITQENWDPLPVKRNVIEWWIKCLFISKTENVFPCNKSTELNKSFVHKLSCVQHNLHEFHSGLLSRPFSALFPKKSNFAPLDVCPLILWSRSSSKYLRIRSVPRREHRTSPLQRSTG